MKYEFKKLSRITVDKVLQSIDLAKREEHTGIYGIEKEFAFTKSSDLFPCQKLGRHSTYKFIMDYGAIPNWLKKRTTPEVFDFMIEVMSEPMFSYQEAVREIMRTEAILWKSLKHIMNEFPNMDEILLSNGMLFKPANIEDDHIPEVWGMDKKAYLMEMVNRYKDHLTPQGMHDNLSLPEPLLILQYQKASFPNQKGNLGYIEFKNETYVWLSCQMRAFASLFIAISANTPFDYEWDDGKFHTIITGNNSSRWAHLPEIESTNYPLILKDYEHFQTISDQLIEKGIIIGANNYMPVRPKGEKRFGEVSLSLERAAWFSDILLGQREIETDPKLKSLKGKENEPFITRLKLAEKTGWLEEKGFNLHDIIEIWQKSNVRRLLGIPLNRIEIRCQEAGGNYEFELAKTAFTQTLFLYIFSHPDLGGIFDYSKEDLKCVHGNEMSATKDGLNGSVTHPFSKTQMNMREFLSHTLLEIKDFSQGLGTYDAMGPIREMAQGDKTESEKLSAQVKRSLGANPKKTSAGSVIVPEEIIRNNLRKRRQYMLSELTVQLNLDLTLSPLSENNQYGT